RHQFSLFLFNYTATTDIYTLSLHDALPIFFLQREKVSGWSKDPISSSVLLLILYIFISLPLVEWPGSVIRNNLSQFVKAVVFFFFAALLIDSNRRLKLFLVVFLGCQVIRVFEPLFLNVTQGYWGSKTHL